MGFATLCRVVGRPSSRHTVPVPLTDTRLPLPTSGSCRDSDVFPTFGRRTTDLQWSQGWHTTTVRQTVSHYEVRGSDGWSRLCADRTPRASTGAQRGSDPLVLGGRPGYRSTAGRRYWCYVSAVVSSGVQRTSLRVSRVRAATVFPYRTEH